MMMTTRAKIKVSQNHEFFPETDDRIVVISGPSDNIQYAIYEIVTKFCEVSVHPSCSSHFPAFPPSSSPLSIIPFPSYHGPTPSSHALPPALPAIPSILPQDL
jgi:hypothetical protein